MDDTPVVLIQEELSMLQDAEVEPELAEMQTSRRRTVLLIDDDEDQTQALAWRLQTQGFTTLTASTGKLGLQTAIREQPDVILLDVQLPDLDGLDVCEQLSDTPATCCIPVIILSGAERSAVVRRARAAGCDYYLRKPYDPNVVLLLVERAAAGDRL
jgi:DNA-binding response OmpR family regulator